MSIFPQRWGFWSWSQLGWHWQECWDQLSPRWVTQDTARNAGGTGNQLTHASRGPDLGGTGGSSEDEVRRAADEVKRNAERAAAFRADREEAVQDRARDAARDAERAAWFLAEREEAAQDMARTAARDTELRLRQSSAAFPDSELA